MYMYIVQLSFSQYEENLFAEIERKHEFHFCNFLIKFLITKIDSIYLFYYLFNVFI